MHVLVFFSLVTMYSYSKRNTSFCTQVVLDYSFPNSNKFSMHIIGIHSSGPSGGKKSEQKLKKITVDNWYGYLGIFFKLHSNLKHLLCRNPTYSSQPSNHSSYWDLLTKNGHKRVTTIAQILQSDPRGKR